MKKSLIALASFAVAASRSTDAAIMVLKPDHLGEKTNINLGREKTAAGHVDKRPIHDHGSGHLISGYIAPIQVHQKSGGGSKCLTHALRLGQERDDHQRVTGAIPTLWRPAHGTSQTAHAAA